MKKWCLFLSVYFCLCMLAACAVADNGAPAAEEPVQSEPKEVSVMVCRVVGDGKRGLLLAKQEGGYGDVYAMPSVLAEEFSGGELVEVTWSGTVQESFPAGLVDVMQMQPLEYGFDDLSRLYLTVLEDLWEVDSGLNESGVDYIGVDLGNTSLWDSEKSAVAHIFAGRHDAQTVAGTWEELLEAGYIAAEPLGTEDAPANAKFYHWENGCHFSVTEKPIVGSYSLKPIAFDAQKWRSSLGAYFFVDCTSVQSALGVWGDYGIGSEMIS